VVADEKVSLFIRSFVLIQNEYKNRLKALVGKVFSKKTP